MRKDTRKQQFMSPQLNGKEYIRKLVNINSLSAVVPLLFFIWVYLESSSEQLIPLVDKESTMIVFIPILIICTLVTIYGMKIFRSQLSKASDSDLLSTKLDLYMKGAMYRSISYSIASMLISIGFFLTDFQVFPALFGITIILFSFANPNARRIVNDLKLRDRNKEIILKGLNVT